MFEFCRPSSKKVGPGTFNQVRSSAYLLLAFYRARSCNDGDSRSANVNLTYLNNRESGFYFPAGKLVGLENGEYTFNSTHGFYGLQAIFASFIANGTYHFSFHTGNFMRSVTELADGFLP